jgi:hypothetical protein
MVGSRSVDVRNARRHWVAVKQDRRNDVRRLADEDGYERRTDRVRKRLPTGG